MVAHRARASQLRRWVLRAGALPRDRGWSMVALVRLVLRYRRGHVYTAVEVGNLNYLSRRPPVRGYASKYDFHDPACRATMRATSVSRVAARVAFLAAASTNVSVVLSISTQKVPKRESLVTIGPGRVDRDTLRVPKTKLRKIFFPLRAVRQN